MDPTPQMAADIAEHRLARGPVSIARFPTGLAHFVYDLAFEHGDPVVVRMGRPSARRTFEAAVRLSRQLRPLGVPLPELIADGSAEPWPYMILERLPGADLGRVANGLSAQALDLIAGRVAEAQAIVGRLPSAGRFGYAADPEQAPFASWPAKIEHRLRIDAEAIAAAGLFAASVNDRMAALFERLRPELDEVTARPFLHDTTTKNVIVTEAGRFSGIVDVDDLCYGDPRFAPALTLASLTASGGPVGYVESWMRQAGLRDDRLFRFYVVRCLHDFLSEHGQAFNGNQPASTEAGRASLLAVYEAALAGVEG